MSDRFREIPSIEQLRQRDGMHTLEATYGRQALVAALQSEAAAVRAQLAGAATIDDVAAHIERRVRRRLAVETAPSLRPVINATGVVIHTNLGRAPLAPAALRHLMAIAGGYCNLEYDVDAGRRGHRHVHAERLVARLTGAEAATVVNNTAAAALVALSALATGREVIVSRGELVEIGGGFRVPDVMALSGAILREVGTTNRTRANDYAAAISDRTAAILRVHRSNFRIEGFTETPAAAELVSLATRFNLPVIEDLGSGYLGAPRCDAMRDEPDARSSIMAGVGLVMFSGDKLLGGPQAGILAGHGPLIERIRRHPLMRALRVDKLTYAVLEATLIEHAAERAVETIPALRMIALSAEAVGRRADALIVHLREAGIDAATVDGASTTGGGSAPGATLPSRLVSIAPPAGAAAFEQALRTGDPPVVARIECDRVLIDLRTVLPEQEATLERRLREALAADR